MATQSEILQLLKRCKPNKLTAKDIRLRLKTHQVARQLLQLRHFGFVKFEKIKINKKGNDILVYWA